MFLTLNLSGSLEIETLEGKGYIRVNTTSDKALSFLLIPKGTEYEDLSTEFTISTSKEEVEICETISVIDN